MRRAGGRGGFLMLLAVMTGAGCGSRALGPDELDAGGDAAAMARTGGTSGGAGGRGGTTAGAGGRGGATTGFGGASGSVGSVDAGPPPMRFDASGIDVGPGAGCGMLPLVGVVAHVECRTGVAPPARGGTLVEGVYALTSIIFYDGCAPFDVAETVSFVNGAFEAVAYALPPASIDDERLAGSYSTAGGNLTVNITCPSFSTDVSPYDATPTTLTMHSVDGHLFVFTRQ